MKFYAEPIKTSPITAITKSHSIKWPKWFLIKSLKMNVTSGNAIVF
jgi:hypothetical protein